MGIRDISRVTICGIGTMGSWIARKLAASGFKVTAYDINESLLMRLASEFGKTENNPIAVTSHLPDAVSGADLVVEAITETIEAKQSLFSNIAPLLAPESIATSNTSMLDPSKFLAGFGQRNRFCCFHFYAPNTGVDIMPLPETDPDVPVALRAVAKRMGEMPIMIKTMTPGYLVPAMVGAATDVALDLAARDVTDIQTIESAWKAVTGMSVGPFGMLDMIGLDTSLLIRQQRLLATPNDERLKRGISLLESYVARGYCGRKTQRGFFSY